MGIPTSMKPSQRALTIVGGWGGIGASSKRKSVLVKLQAALSSRQARKKKPDSVVGFDEIGVSGRQVSVGEESHPEGRGLALP